MFFLVEVTSLDPEQYDMEDCFELQAVIAMSIFDEGHEGRIISFDPHTNVLVIDEDGTRIQE